MVFDTLVPYKGRSALARAADYMFPRRRNYERFIRAGRNRVRAMNRQRQALSRTQTVNSRRRRGRSGQGVTTQNDRKMIYRRKTMPKFKKRRWRSFVKKVHAVAEKELGSRTVVFNTQISQYNQVDATQGLLTLALYSGNSSNDWLNDLRNISGGENTGNPTSAAGITVDSTTKFLMQSGVMDVTIRNNSGTVSTPGAPPVISPDNRAKLELDIYEISMSKQAQHALNTYGNLCSMFQAEEPQIKTLNDQTTYNLQLPDRGVTPFDLPYVIGRFGLKIWKKTKFFLPNGETLTYQIRDPRRYTLTMREMAQIEGFNHPGQTRILLVVYKLVPGLIQNSTLGSYVSSIDVGVTRKYMYKIEGANEDRDYHRNQAAVIASPS